MVDSVGGSEGPGSFNLGKNENTKNGELSDELMRCDSEVCSTSQASWTTRIRGQLRRGRGVRSGT